MPPHSSTEQFRERLLAIMDRKHHWAWPHFSGARITKDQLKIHFRQEYAVYVRDFPVFLARIYGNNPPHDVRSLLAENIYEEDTGRLSLGCSHPELFLKMTTGLGFAQAEFQNVELLPASRLYRQWLEDIAMHPNWRLGIAATTILVEGSIKDRQEIHQPPSPKSQAQIQEVVANHPLVLYHGLPPEHLDLIRAHQMIEPSHRHAAYHMVLTHAVEPHDQESVLNSLEEGLSLWLRYRDGVAKACGLTEP